MIASMAQNVMATRSGLLAKNVRQTAASHESCPNPIQTAANLFARQLSKPPTDYDPQVGSQKFIWVEVAGRVSNGGSGNLWNFVSNSLEEHLRILGAVTSQ